MSSRKNTDGYKREAVALTRLPGATVTAIARDLGINAHVLGKWRVIPIQALSSRYPFAQRNVNMVQIHLDNGNHWPADSSRTSVWSLRWLHSDFRDIALPYVYHTWEQFLTRGSFRL